MKQGIILLLLIIILKPAAAASIDETFRADRFDDAFHRFKAIYAQLGDDDGRFFQIGFERLRIDLMQHSGRKLAEPERQRLFLATVDGLSLRKIILIGCTAYVNQAREALRGAKGDGLLAARLDVEQAESILRQATEKYASL